MPWWFQHLYLAHAFKALYLAFAWGGLVALLLLPKLLLPLFHPLDRYITTFNTWLTGEPRISLYSIAMSAVLPPLLFGRAVCHIILATTRASWSGEGDVDSSLNAAKKAAGKEAEELQQAEHNARRSNGEEAGLGAVHSEPARDALRPAVRCVAVQKSYVECSLRDKVVGDVARVVVGYCGVLVTSAWLGV